MSVQKWKTFKSFNIHIT